MPVEWFFLGMAALPLLLLVHTERRVSWTEGTFTVERTTLLRHAAGDAPGAHHQALGTTHTPEGDVPARTIDSYPVQWIRARVGQQVPCRYKPGSPDSVTLRAVARGGRRVKNWVTLIGLSVFLVLVFLLIRSQG
ncbi:hypothetical protein [Ornithinicoccus halotolerans]|uniref:hypothetical protein n=1 Tax=Ornithinicoccus halotolerans TaxID=1748220 RepID=UPI001296B8FF|nr:hypothetical protein [Ornithinicoccus halotolerans]